MTDDKKEFFENNYQQIKYNLITNRLICNKTSASCVKCLFKHDHCTKKFKKELQTFLRMKKLEKLLSQ